MALEFTPTVNTPWCHTVPDHRKNCHIWSKIFWEYLDIVHTGCHKCYKVVCRPKTMTQLIQIKDIQEKMGKPAKCGAEVREEVFGPWGSYWYNVDIHEGLERLDEVKDAIRQGVDGGFKLAESVILKRACTEMEAKHGPSNMWRLAPNQKELEAVFDDMFSDVDREADLMPKEIQSSVFNFWLYHAHCYGDETYKQYTGGQPMHPPYVTYTREGIMVPDCYVA